MNRTTTSKITNKNEQKEISKITKKKTNNNNKNNNNNNNNNRFKTHKGILLLCQDLIIGILLSRELKIRMYG